MRRQHQWLFESPPISTTTEPSNSYLNQKRYHYPKEELAWNLPSYEYIPSSVRQTFEQNVRNGDWRNAFLNLNGLNMFEMLRTLESLQSVDLTQLWARRTSHGAGLNLPRIAYAREIVLNKALPATAVGDLRQTGQVADSANFLAEKFAKVVPKSVNPSPANSISLILQECNLQGIIDKSHIAYVLASAHHESGMGRNMTEFASGKAYEGRKDLGNTQPGDGPRFKGRGFVQITGRKNYTQYKQWIKTLRRRDIDLVNDPVRSTQPDIAAFIIAHGMKNGTFTGKRLTAFGTDPKYDFVNARKIVNGLDKAQAIAVIARKYRATMA